MMPPADSIDLPTERDRQHTAASALATGRASGLETLPRRVADIAMLRGLGYSFREIARQLDVSPQAISLMLSRHRKCLLSARGASEMRTLSARAVSCLSDLGITCRAEAQGKDVLMLLKGRANCGRKTIDEIAVWLGEECGTRVAPQTHSSDRASHLFTDPTPSLRRTG